MMGSPRREGTASASRCRCCSLPTTPSSASAHASTTSSKLSTSPRHPHSGKGSGQRATARSSRSGSPDADSPNASLQENTTLQVLRDIANRTRALDQQAQEYNRQIDTLARELAPALMDEPGVGPICAAKLIAFNPTRFKSEAAFARANGTAPQPASSGKTVRHRLSRGGDRQSTQRSTRSRSHAPSTTPPAAPRSNAEPKKARPAEAMRSLKRYLSRDLYNKLSNTPLTT